MAKIAVEASLPTVRLLASGEGWSVSDVVCTAGPKDKPFEEQHTGTSIAVVSGGTFQYRSSNGRELMTPGSLLLGNAGDCFCCGHEHGTGDRCIAFSYTAAFFERVAREAAADRPRFKVARIPPLRSLSPVIARAVTLMHDADPLACEELSIEAAAGALQAQRGLGPRRSSPEPSSFERVTRVLRMIENEADMPQTIASLARIARLSPYHFLRAFEELTGTTPHQYILRMRLRRAALRLRSERRSIAEIALACGFGDISNFNRTFRAEFGLTPRAYRADSYSLMVSIGKIPTANPTGYAKIA